MNIYNVQQVYDVSDFSTKRNIENTNKYFRSNMRTQFQRLVEDINESGLPQMLSTYILNSVPKINRHESLLDCSILNTWTVNPGLNKLRVGVINILQNRPSVFYDFIDDEIVDTPISVCVAIYTHLSYCMINVHDLLIDISHIYEHNDKRYNGYYLYIAIWVMLRLYILLSVNTLVRENVLNDVANVILGELFDVREEGKNCISNDAIKYLTKKHICICALNFVFCVNQCQIQNCIFQFLVKLP